jgi:hypothetical protein
VPDYCITFSAATVHDTFRPLRLAALLLGALAAASVPSAAQTPAGTATTLAASANLVYKTELDLGGFPLHLSSRTTTTWHRDAGGYESHLHMDTGGFDQVSRGAVGPDGTLVPTSYTEKRPFHSPESVSIDWKGGQIQFGDKTTGPVPAAGAQDRLSLQFELARLRLSHPEEFAPGSRHEVHLIGTHDIDPWTFVVGPEEAIETGRGAMRAVRYSARRKVGSVEETFDIWLGADIQWMPVRIRMVDRKASVIDSVLQSSDLP